jgi:ribosomal protein S18 acetylase RimI-like enzyme
MESTIAENHKKSDQFEIVRICGRNDTKLFDRVAAVHIESLPDGFLSRFGIHFLSVMYHGLSLSENMFMLGAFEDEKLLGFLCCSDNIRMAYWQTIVKKWPRLAVHATGVILKNPSVIYPMLETMSYPQRASSVGGLDDSFPEIVNFCVALECQRRGIGKAMLLDMARWLSMSGFRKIKAVTGLSQTGAQMFYESVGAKKFATVEVHRNSKSIAYLIDAEECIASISKKSD